MSTYAATPESLDVERSLNSAKALVSLLSEKYWTAEYFSRSERQLREFNAEVDYLLDAWDDLTSEQKRQMFALAYNLLAELNQDPPASEREASHSLSLRRVLQAIHYVFVSRKVERTMRARDDSLWRFCDAVLSRAESESEWYQEMVAERLVEARGPSTLRRVPKLGGEKEHAVQSVDS